MIVIEVSVTVIVMPVSEPTVKVSLPIVNLSPFLALIVAVESFTLTVMPEPEFVVTLRSLLVNPSRVIVGVPVTVMEPLNNVIAVAPVIVGESTVPLFTVKVLLLPVAVTLKVVLEFFVAMVTFSPAKFS